MVGERRGELAVVREEQEGEPTARELLGAVLRPERVREKQPDYRQQPGITAAA
jgi:hypothetical protein